MSSAPASPDPDAALAAHTRDSLAALSPEALLDTAAALAASCRTLRSSLAASASVYILPDELLSRALHKLPLVSKARACAVSRRFKRLLWTPALRAALDPTRMLLSERSLLPGCSIDSPDGRLTLIYQHDANFVLYWRRDGGQNLQPIWALQTVNVLYNRNTAGRVTLRRDGVLAVRNSRGETYWETPWSPAGTAPYRLVVRNEGDFVLLDADDAVVWAAAVAVRPTPE
jgi:hypothetical protein